MCLEHVIQLILKVFRNSCRRQNVLYSNPRSVFQGIRFHETAIRRGVQDFQWSNFYMTGTVYYCNAKCGCGPVSCEFLKLVKREINSKSDNWF